MEIIFCSDLHVDFYQPKIIWPDGDVLVIAGDTANTIGQVLELVQKTAKLYRHVVMVDGNHESYSNYNNQRTVEDTIASISSQLPPNVHILGHHKPRIDIEGVHFVGCNGWYSFDASGDPIANRKVWRDSIKDCKRIGFDTIEQSPPWERARADADLVRHTIEQIIAEGRREVYGGSGEALTDWPVVVITHTAPHREMVLWRDGDLEWNRSNSFYVNTYMQDILEGDLGKRITVWSSGHTHFRKEKMIGQTLCICNPRGNPSENPSWEPVSYRIIM